MSTRTILHHASLRINPPPRSLRESREIYRSLRKFGEIDLYRNLRHETSTLEAKEDAIVLFRDGNSLGEAIAASPLSISVPAPQPSPIPSSGPQGESLSIEVPRVHDFTVEVLKGEYHHETKIINQLFTYLQAPYPVNQESPPGVSIRFSNAGKTADANRQKHGLVRSTSISWITWRSEMKQAGIIEFEAIKAVVDGTVGSRDPTIPPHRQGYTGWGRPLDAVEAERPASAQVLSKINAISNPAPLPLDPILHSSKRRSQFQAWNTGSWRTGENNIPARHSPQVGSRSKLSPNKPGKTKVGAEATSTPKLSVEDQITSEGKSSQAIRTPPEKTDSSSPNAAIETANIATENNSNLLHAADGVTTTWSEDVISSPYPRMKRENSEGAELIKRTIEPIESTQDEKAPCERIDLKQDVLKHLHSGIDSEAQNKINSHRDDKFDPKKHIELQKQVSKPWWKFW
ncbi:hypothetical protein TWF694_010651 [Orbilia ellipsospora]|uniref:Uncharacterized protein n=1 Tax=Orbilia ellipsospora TaxID=2528407 RepID=A0AAV9XAW2_9PEZI